MLEFFLSGTQLVWIRNIRTFSKLITEILYGGKILCQIWYIWSIWLIRPAESCSPWYSILNANSLESLLKARHTESNHEERALAFFNIFKRLAGKLDWTAFSKELSWCQSIFGSIWRLQPSFSIDLCKAIYTPEFIIIVRSVRLITVSHLNILNVLSDLLLTKLCDFPCKAFEI